LFILPALRAFFVVQSSGFVRHFVAVGKLPRYTIRLEEPGVGIDKGKLYDAMEKEITG
jgi:hypothetical protein